MPADAALDESGVEMRRHYILVFVTEAVVIAALVALGRIFS